MLVVRINETINMELISPYFADEIYKVVNENRSYLRDFLPWVDKTQNSEDVYESIKRGLLSFSEKKGLSYVIKENNDIIGRISIWENNENTCNYEIGYWLAEKNSSKGIMTLCVREIMKIGIRYLNVMKYEIQCADKNEASNKIAKKLKFTLEGTIRNSEQIRENIYNLNIYGLMRNEFQEFV